jgi:hypothetical protein
VDEGDAIDHPWEESWTTERNKKVAKADDAEVPKFLWDQVLVPSGDRRQLWALGILQGLALRWWKRRLQQEFLE